MTQESLPNIPWRVGLQLLDRMALRFYTEQGDDSEVAVAKRLIDEGEEIVHDYLQVRDSNNITSETHRATQIFRGYTMVSAIVLQAKSLEKQMPLTDLSRDTEISGMSLHLPIGNPNETLVEFYQDFGDEPERAVREVVEEIRTTMSPSIDSTLFEGLDVTELSLRKCSDLGLVQDALEHSRDRFLDLWFELNQPVY